MTGLLDGLRILVTGCRGICEAVALLAAEEGADVALTWLSEPGKETAERHVDTIRKLGRRAYAHKLDIRHVAEIKSVVSQILDEFGTIDALINCAGIYTYNPPEKTTEEQWDLNVDTDLKGAFFMSAEVAKQAMIPQKRGRIVHISTFVATTPVSNLAAYNIAKSGVNFMTKNLALEWAKYGIQVNCVSPGYVATEPMLAAIARGDADGESIKRNCPMGRLAEPKEIAEVCVYLASRRCPDYLTGANIMVDGGYSSGMRFVSIDFDERKTHVW